MSSVSVVIPCYNYGHFLEDAVASVLDDQPGVDVRVLIIDDASPDNSAEVARKIAAREPRVEVLVNETNKGNIGTYNVGLLEWADGDYCVLLSADDRLTPGALGRARDLMDANPDVGFVYGRALWVKHGAPLPAARTSVRGWSVWPGHWWIERRYRDAECPITSPEVVVRTSVHKRVGGYDPRLPHAADLQLWLRLAANSDVGFIRGVDQAFYRLHERNMRTGFNTLRDLTERRLSFTTVLELYGERLPDAEGMSGRVHRALGREALWHAGLEQHRGSHGQQAVDDLLAFASDCWPEVTGQPLYRTLAAGKRIGPRGAYYMLDRTGRWWLRRRGWKYRGY
jgi:glycosyltransferase involved in cell wall biosynthesis